LVCDLGYAEGESFCNVCGTNPIGRGIPDWVTLDYRDVPNNTNLPQPVVNINCNPQGGPAPWNVWDVNCPQPSAVNGSGPGTVCIDLMGNDGTPPDGVTWFIDPS